jgi:hypothetical protein
MACTSSALPRTTVPLHSFILAYPQSAHCLPNTHNNAATHLCLCFGFLLQIIYTYLPPFLRTLLHPSHSFFTELRTFMPRVCCAPCMRSPERRDVSALRTDGRARRSSGLQAHVEVWMWVWRERARWLVRGKRKRVRRMGRRRDRGSISAVC